VRNEFEALRKRRLDEFMSGFQTIGLKLKEMYQMITMGGDAELELVDSLDPFSEGIVFSVRFFPLSPVHCVHPPTVCVIWLTQLNFD
jgi:chromosome segregation ATPase